jgi:hypothetical protein
VVSKLVPVGTTVAASKMRGVAPAGGSALSGRGARATTGIGNGRGGSGNSGSARNSSSAFGVPNGAGGSGATAAAAASAASADGRNGLRAPGGFSGLGVSRGNSEIATGPIVRTSPIWIMIRSPAQSRVPFSSVPSPDPASVYQTTSPSSSMNPCASATPSRSMCRSLAAAWPMATRSSASSKRKRSPVPASSTSSSRGCFIAAPHASGDAGVPSLLHSGRTWQGTGRCSYRCVGQVNGSGRRPAPTGADRDSAA